MDEGKIQIGIIGAGRAGKVHIRNLMENIPNVSVNAIVDEKFEIAKSVGDEFHIKNICDSVEKCFDLCDAVVITTPTFTHCNLVISAAQAGKNIFCEKPMALNVFECDRMLETVDKFNVKLQIGFMRRFDPDFQLAKERITKGEIGNLTIVKSTGRGPGLPPRWSWDISKSNGIVAEVSSHDFDTLRWLIDSEPIRIYAEADSFKTKDILKEFPDFYDNVVCVIRFQNGVIATVDGTCPAEYGYDARVEALGTQGVIFIGDLQEQSLLICNTDKIIRTKAYSGWPLRFKEAYIQEIKHFLHCIRTNKIPSVTGIDGKKAVELAVAANQSIREQHPIGLID